MVLQQFLNMRPQKFLGRGESAIAEEWLARMNRIFKVLKCSERQKVKLATFQLEGSAGHWWNTLEGIHQEREMEWSDFQMQFLNKYFPEELRKERISEFLELKQGGMTVTEYADKFLELS